jgi:hypothetical protein
MRWCSSSRSSVCLGIADVTAVTSRMRRLTILAVLLVSVLGPTAAFTSSAAAARSVAPASQLLAFRGGFHFSGGGGFGRRHVGIGGFGRRSSSHTLRRVAHAVAFAYFLHLFFSHGGLSIVLWLLVIGLIMHFVRRRRSRRYV